MKNLLVIVMCISCLIANAQVPFEKKGKWGIMNEAGKTLVKPKYVSLKPAGEIENRFVVQGKVKRPFEGDRLRYGVIDSDGKQIIPIAADSIEVTKSGFIASISEGESVGATRWCLTYKIIVYDGNGNIKESIPGQILKKLPGGFLVGSNASCALYNKDYAKIDDVESIEMIRDGAIITHTRGRGYTYRDDSTLKPIISFDHYEPFNDNNDILIISDPGSWDRSYGYINLKDKTYQEPIFRLEKLSDGSRRLYMNDSDTCFILNVDGSLSEAISSTYYDKHSDQKKYFFKRNEAGLYKLDDLEINEFMHSRELRGFYSVRKDNKWGLYNIDEKELVVPFILSGPVVKMNKEYILLSMGDGGDTYRLCDINGNNIFDVSSENKIDLKTASSNYIYTCKEDGSVTGIYSLGKKKWLFEPGKYGAIYTISDDRFAAEVAPNKYHYVDADGTILNTFNDIYQGFFNVSDLINVKSTSGKIGFFHPRTGKWIFPCKFDDYTFGGGSGANRKIALIQKSDKGELITVYTVSGNKIASQFFPWGMFKRNAAIRTFGERNLNH